MAVYLDRNRKLSLPTARVVDLAATDSNQPVNRIAAPSLTPIVPHHFFLWFAASATVALGTWFVARGAFPDPLGQPTEEWLLAGHRQMVQELKAVVAEVEAAWQGLDPAHPAETLSPFVAATGRLNAKVLASTGDLKSAWQAMAGFYGETDQRVQRSLLRDIAGWEHEVSNKVAVLSSTGQVLKRGGEIPLARLETLKARSGVALAQLSNTLLLYEERPGLSRVLELTQARYQGTKSITLGDLAGLQCGDREFEAGLVLRDLVEQTDGEQVAFEFLRGVGNEIEVTIRNAVRLPTERDFIQPLVRSNGWRWTSAKLANRVDHYTLHFS